MNRLQLKRLGTYSAVAIVAVSVTLLAVRARAAGIPDAAALTYTGYLEEPDGTPVTTTKGIGISLYAAETGGKEVCGVKPADIVPISGRFQITLPDDCTDAVKANPELWAEVIVEGSLLGRTKLGAVPYAVEAAHATSADAAVLAETATIAENARRVSAFRAHATKVQAVPASSTTTLVFDSEDFDIGNEYDVVTGVFTAKQAGIYTVRCGAYLPSAPGSSWEVMILRSAAGGIQGMTNGTGAALEANDILELAKGDTLRCGMFAPGPLSTAGVRSSFSAARLY